MQVRSNRKPRGFTLVEMLVVVAILVALAGMILPKLDKEQLRANKGIAANNMAGLSRYVQLYYSRHNLYPDRWDSLLTGGTTLWVPGAPGTTPGLDPQLVGGPPDGSPHKLTVSTALTELEVRSLSRIGIATVLDRATSSTAAPGNAFNVARPLAEDGLVATLNNASDDDAKAIVDGIYPENKLSTGVSGTIPAGKRLVVFGFGPINSAIGDVLQECPTYANTDSTQYYNRLLCIFEVDSGGSRAQLKKVVGGDADQIAEEVADYYEK